MRNFIIYYIIYIKRKFKMTEFELEYYELKEKYDNLEKEFSGYKSKISD